MGTSQALELISRTDRVGRRHVADTGDAGGAAAGPHVGHSLRRTADVLLGRPVRLDLDGVREKLVGARRGGYCFEDAYFFAAAIEELGFHPICHSARVLLFFPRTELPRTHMFLTVKLPEGRFVADPGFGGPGAQHRLPLVDAGDATPAPARRTGWRAMAPIG